MPSETQDGFLFETTTEPADPPDPLSDFFADIIRAWGVPVGERVRVRLHDSALPELEGKLKLTRSPDLPLNPKQVLSLSLCGIEFTHREIAAWALVE